MEQLLVAYLFWRNEAKMLNVFNAQLRAAYSASIHTASRQALAKTWERGTSCRADSEQDQGLRTPQNAPMDSRESRGPFVPGVQAIS